MRAAILADIHGNSLALDAVLDDIHSKGIPDAYWLLGDYAAIGPDPVGVIERLRHLGNAIFIRGNTDYYVAKAQKEWSAHQEFEGDQERIAQYIEMVRSFAWTTGALAPGGYLSWLTSLPLEHSDTLPDGTKTLLVHASPGTDSGTGIHPGLDDRQVAKLIGEVDVDLLLVGHVHVPYQRELDLIKIINPGSVSNPFPPDIRACYAILEAGPEGYSVQWHRVAYDNQAVIDLAQSMRHPSQDYITRFMRGEVRPFWLV